VSDPTNNPIEAPSTGWWENVKAFFRHIFSKKND